MIKRRHEQYYFLYSDSTVMAIIRERNDKEDLLSSRYTIYYIEEARIKWGPLSRLLLLNAPATSYPEYYHMMKNRLTVHDSYM